MQLTRLSFQAFCIVVGLGIGVLGCTPSSNKTANADSTQSSPAITTAQDDSAPRGDVPYVPTPPEVVSEMLNIAKVNKNDMLYDLGSGDGRIVIEAARRYGMRGVGVDINPELVKEATDNARKAGVSDRASFVEQDLFKTDLSKATVVTLYLLPEVNMRLRPKLFRELKPGTRIVSHAFDMGDWKPERVVEVDGRTIYYWVVPKEIPTSLKN
jgi:SAM-dependent methyltransferase